jgi:hypothetical protein
MEYSTTLVLGEERGMVKSSGYPYDTQRDLLNNLVGVLVALGLMAVARAWRGREVEDRTSNVQRPTLNVQR